MRRLALVAIIAASACTRGAPPPYKARIGAVGSLTPLTAAPPEGYPAVVHALVFEPLLSPRRSGPWSAPLFSDLDQLDAGRMRLRLAPSRTFSDGTPVEPSHVISAVAKQTSVTEASGWLQLTANSPAVLLDMVVARESRGGPVGTGPFFVVHQDEERITLRRREPAPGRIEEVELHAYRSSGDVFAASLRGEVNVLVMPSEGQIELFEGVSSLRVIRGPGLHSVVALFNTAKIDLQTRRMLVDALPLAEISAPLGSACRPRSTRALVELAPLGKALTVSFVNLFQGMAPMALALRRALGPSGGLIQASTVQVALQRLRSGDFDLLLINSQTWPEELALSRWVTGAPENWGRYSNPAFDAAFKAGNFAGAKAALEADPPALFICDLERTAAVDARLFDARLGDYDALELLPTWKVAPPP